MQEILIGRDPENNTLKISTNGKSVNGGKVTNTMSREHCIITRKSDGTAIIKNINPKNVTFVNGQPVTTKTIYGNDVVELGADKYKLDLTPFKLTKIANIRHLEFVWNSYKQNQDKIRISQIRKNALRSATGILTMGAILISFSGNEKISFLRYILYGLAIVFIIWTAWSDIFNPGKSIDKVNKMQQQFQDDYVCPNCGTFLGSGNSFDLLIKNGECHKCHTKFKC